MVEIFSKLRKRAEHAWQNLTTRRSRDSSPSPLVNIETEHQAIQWEVSNETDHENPFLHNPAVHGDSVRRLLSWKDVGAGFFPVSLEGFHHNPEAHRFLGSYLAKKFHLQKGSTILEFAPGTNYELSKGLTVNGASSQLLDYQSRDTDSKKDLFLPQTTSRKALDQFPILSGDIAEAFSPGSVLRNRARSFDFIACHGAMVANGNNFTLSETAQGKYRQLHKDEVITEEKSDAFVDEEFRKTFEAVRKLLKPGGTFFFSSSRYANHGAGFPVSRLAEEKANFVRLIDLARENGAKKITLWGISPTGMAQNIEYNFPKDHHRVEQQKLVIEQFFVGHHDQAEYYLEKTTPDGRIVPIHPGDIRERIQTEEGVQSILADPEVEEFVNAQVDQNREFATSLVEKISGPVDQLPEHELFAGITADVIQRAKRRNTDLPTSIARIDAVAVTF